MKILQLKKTKFNKIFYYNYSKYKHPSAKETTNIERLS